MSPSKGPPGSGAPARRLLTQDILKGHGHRPRGFRCAPLMGQPRFSGCRIGVRHDGWRAFASFLHALSAPHALSPSFPRRPPFVIPDIFNRGSRAFTFSFFLLDAGSGSGMTNDACGFLDAGSGSGMTNDVCSFLDAGSKPRMTVRSLAFHHLRTHPSPSFPTSLIGNPGFLPFPFFFWMPDRSPA